jgi:hypothetical protein
MAINLGKDASVSVDGTVIGARDVSISLNVETIEVNEWMTAKKEKFPIGYSGKISVETNDGADVTRIRTNIEGSGSTISVSAGEGGISFTGVITSLEETADLYGVCTYQITAEFGKSGLSRPF